MKVFIIGDMPDALLKPFVQHVRDFDTANPDCHFKMSMQVPDMDLGQMIEALKVDPPFAFTEVRKLEGS